MQKLEKHYKDGSNVYLAVRAEAGLRFHVHRSANIQLVHNSIGDRGHEAQVVAREFGKVILIGTYPVESPEAFHAMQDRAVMYWAMAEEGKRWIEEDTEHVARTLQFLFDNGAIEVKYRRSLIRLTPRGWYAVGDYAYGTLAEAIAVARVEEMP